MRSRPPSITIISWIFIVFGSISLLAGLLPSGHETFAQRLAELKGFHLLVHVVRVLAIVGGVFMLYGRNWARWLLVAWMVFHLVVSALHSTLMLFFHALIFTGILYLLFRPPASAYFDSAKS